MVSVACCRARPLVRGTHNPTGTEQATRHALLGPQSGCSRHLASGAGSGEQTAQCLWGCPGTCGFFNGLGWALRAAGLVGRVVGQGPQSTSDVRQVGPRPVWGCRTVFQTQGGSVQRGGTIGLPWPQTRRAQHPPWGESPTWSFP